MNSTLPEMLIQPNPTLIVRVGLVRVVELVQNALWAYTLFNKSPMTILHEKSIDM